jgi:hypothetical protein
MCDGDVCILDAVVTLLKRLPNGFYTTSFTRTLRAAIWRQMLYTNCLMHMLQDAILGAAAVVR